MKKYSIAVCVCAVLFSVGIHGGGMREVFARAPGADENLAILQDIIRENECQAGMAFLGYTYEGAEAAEILEYTRQGEVSLYKGIDRYFPDRSQGAGKGKKWMCRQSLV